MLLFRTLATMKTELLDTIIYEANYNSRDLSILIKILIDYNKSLLIYSFFTILFVYTKTFNSLFNSLTLRSRRL